MYVLIQNQIEDNGKHWKNKIICIFWNLFLLFSETPITYLYDILKLKSKTKIASNKCENLNIYLH